MTKVQRTTSRVPGSKTPLNRVQELQRQIEELRKSWPAHSTPPALLQRLEELEEELEDEMSKGEG